LEVHDFSLPSDSDNNSQAAKKKVNPMTTLTGIILAPGLVFIVWWVSQHPQARSHGRPFIEQRQGGGASWSLDIIGVVRYIHTLHVKAER
jgi:hypothetical protein